jgi:hypothetical protein
MRALPLAFSTCLCLAALGLAGCGASIKELGFSVDEGGRKVHVEKFFNDGLGGDNAAAHAFEAATRNDIAGAMQIMKDDIARDPKDAWDHYNLGILYEATAEWDKAEAEMKEAQRLDSAATKGKPNTRFAEEIAFIDRHKAKR